MESVELTEDQFKLIKMFCMNNSVAIVCLHPIDTDPDKIKEQHAKNLENMKALEKAGFAVNLNDQCKDALQYAKETGNRSFDLYEITDEAYRMFSAPEGNTN